MMHSRKYSSYYHTMPDGTVKQTNPYSGNEVWSIPGRGKKPLLNGGIERKNPVNGRTDDPACIFCPQQHRNIAPEKARTSLVNNRHETVYYNMPGRGDAYSAEFRRVANMFEIVTTDYWKHNYRFRLPRTVEQWRDTYCGDPAGAEHIEELLRYKLARMDMDADEAALRESIVDGLFGGCHDLIIGPRHFAYGAVDDGHLCSSGELTPEEHFRYFSFTIDAMRNMLEINPYIRYIAVFQNWLKAAGASIDHLHKQICALDEWGSAVSDKVSMALKDPNIFNELGVNLASQHNLVFARNDHAVAFVGIGHRFPTIEIFSTSPASRPFQQTREELRGFSDMVHACHAALGHHRPCNEEWFYTPVDAVYAIPWHVELKWRVNVQAGFEGGTGIFINPVLPVDFRDLVAGRLAELSHAGLIDTITVVEGYLNDPNPLKYCRSAS